MAEIKNKNVAEYGSKSYFLLKTENNPNIAAAKSTMKSVEKLLRCN